MKKIGEFIVNFRYILLLIMLVTTGLSIYLMSKVNINQDMTKYLSDSSNMKQGIDIMKEEFSNLSMDNTIRVMFNGLSDEDALNMKQRLSNIKNVSSVDYETDNSDYNNESYKLFVVKTSYEYNSDEELAIEETIENDFNEHEMIYMNDNSSKANIPIIVLIVAFIILMVILFAMCGSYLEPILFLFTIGCAMFINMESNVLLSSVSNVTYSITALLQLVLSMDYSIILMNRYRQEKQLNENNNIAMKNAITNAILSISSSAVTTIVGLLMLVFMSFKIGADLGIVLAKGVFISMLCIIIILPALILLFDKAINKTAKKVLDIPMNKVSEFIYKNRKIFTILFVLLFILAFVFKSRTQMSYANTAIDPIKDIFPGTDQIVILYDNADDEIITNYSYEIANMDGIISATNYSNSLGKALTANELLSFIGGMGLDSSMPEASFLNENTIKLIYYVYFTGLENFDLSSLGISKLDSETTANMDAETFDKMLTPILANYNEDWTVTINELFNFITEDVAEDERFSSLFDDDTKTKLKFVGPMLNSAKSQLCGENHSMLAITTTLDNESEATSAFYGSLIDWADKNLSGKYYLIGNSAMVYEMQHSFSKELNFITLLTAVAIFIVVMISFRALIIPLILVLVVQCGVYITITTIGFQGYSINYLALLIVQCILMGATIDYGILFTTYYKENRTNTSTFEAIKSAYNGSIHTILTSGLIMILVCGIAGRFFEEPTIGAICRTLAIGALSTTLLILFLLPCILATFDKLFYKKNNA